MCGIAGFWDRGRFEGSRSWNEQVARRMAAAIRHRGPDEEGFWLLEDGSLVLTHRRLSIIDLTPSGHQPMTSADGRFTIAFNGEIYNYRELRSLLVREGARFRGTSDTEVMLEAFSFWGIEASVAKFTGMFAFAVWDAKEHLLTVARDRFGEKPLYYLNENGLFAFASELKALCCLPGLDLQIDASAVASYMQTGYIPAPLSIYQQIRKLLPGTFMQISLHGQPACTTYWSALNTALEAQQHPLVGNDDYAMDALQKKLTGVIERQMVADVPLGAFLSGGIDSSLIAAIMQSVATGPVKTFTIGFKEADYDESDQARAVASYLKTDHTELVVSPDEAINVIPQLAEIYDEPFADSSQIPTYLLSKMTRSSVTVSLSGDGGDEVFGGYNRYALSSRLWKQSHLFPLFCRRTVSAVIRLAPASFIDSASVILGGMSSRYGLKGSAADRLFRLANAMEAESATSLFRLLGSLGSENLLVGDAGKSRNLSNGFDQFSDTFAGHMMFDTLSYLPDDILVKVDRAAMACSLEGRIPLLDHELFAFAWSLPHHLKYRNGQGKWILRQLLYKYIPQEMVDRPKTGFGIPIGRWLKGPLRDWANELLSTNELESSGFLNVELIRTLWQQHLSGYRNWQHQIWAVLMFQSWLQNQSRLLSSASLDLAATIS